MYKYNNDTISGGALAVQQTDTNPWHHPPSSQIVITLAGTWYIQPNDYSGRKMLPPGSILYQDNTANHPACADRTGKVPKCAEHMSGVFPPGQPANVLVLPVSRAPVTGGKCPF